MKSSGLADNTAWYFDCLPSGAVRTGNCSFPEAIPRYFFHTRIELRRYEAVTSFGRFQFCPAQRHSGSARIRRSWYNDSMVLRRFFCVFCSEISAESVSRRALFRCAAGLAVVEYRYRYAKSHVLAETVCPAGAKKASDEDVACPVPSPALRETLGRACALAMLSPILAASTERRLLLLPASPKGQCCKHPSKTV